MSAEEIKSRLNLFSPFEDLRFSSITWDTSVQASVTKYIVVNLHTLMLLDKKASPHTQPKEVLGIGLSYRFI